MTEVPVALIVYNRPHLAARVFDEVRKSRPRRLLIIADGPKSGSTRDRDLCEQTLDLVTNVDWPCDVSTNVAPFNLGLRSRVSSGLDWVFDLVERAIILEDDCLPHPDFFSFCAELLDRFADNERVALITGNNFQAGTRRGDGSYYFSRYPHIWGWATWRSTWERLDLSMGFWPRLRASQDWQDLFPRRDERHYWNGIFDRTFSGEVDSWAYAMTACLWRDHHLTATPNVNLVSNIGFGAGATNTTRWVQPMDTQSVGTLIHPSVIQVDHFADRAAFVNHFRGNRRSRMRRLLTNRTGGPK